ncbi:MAG: hypothetical protein U9R75_01410 [Candidatus Thermoplasmatota archaeon]|nr:hypothetical protein [Candidatus Thermoplasmatota archaeon]
MDLDRIGPVIGMIGGALGMGAGLFRIEDDLYWLTGNKVRTFTLGLVTVLLSFLALYSSFRWKYPSKKKETKMIMVLIGLLVPSVICFMTAGVLWFIPGAFLLTSAGMLSNRMIRNRGPVSKDAEKIPFRGKYACLVTLGCVLIASPVLLGILSDDLSLVHHMTGTEEAGTMPLDKVWSIDDSGERHEDKVTGVLLMNISLLISSISIFVSGLLGKRNLSIGNATAILVILLFFFIFIPNILFTRGIDITLFSGDHFRSVSIGMYSVMLGGAIILGSNLHFGRRSKTMDKGGTS